MASTVATLGAVVYQPIKLPRQMAGRVHPRRDRPSGRALEVARRPSDVRLPPDPDEAKTLLTDLTSDPEGLADGLWRQGVPYAMTAVVSLDLLQPASDRAADAVLYRFRTLLAACTDEEYSSALSTLGDLRRTASDSQRIAASYLAPTEIDWVSADRTIDIYDRVPELHLGWWLMAASTSEHLATVDDPRTLARAMKRPKLDTPHPGDVIATLADTFGHDLTPHLARWLAGYLPVAPVETAMVRLAMVIESEDAWRAVLARVHSGQAAASRVKAFKDGLEKSPELAALVFLDRLAAGDGFAKQHRYLAEQLLLQHPDTVTAARSRLEPATLDLLDELAATAGSGRDQHQEEPVSEAGVVGDLPALLVEPPWKNRKKSAKRLTVADVQVLAVEPTIRWAEGERKRFLARPWRRQPIENPAGRWDELTPEERTTALVSGDVEELRHLAPSWRCHYWFTFFAGPERIAAARYELSVLSALLILPEEVSACESWRVLVPYGAIELAAPMVELHSRRLKRSEIADTWLTRHPNVAATYLIPRVVSPERKGRNAAENALRHVARTDEAVIREVAGSYGAEVVAAIDQLLSIDPLDVLPTRIPTLPTYLVPSLLEATAVAASGQPLPPETVENFLVMCALSKETPYAGRDQVAEHCEPDSLARFAWSATKAWISAGAVRKDDWVPQLLRAFGNDSILHPIEHDEIGAQYPGRKDSRVRMQLDALESIGSQSSLELMFAISQTIKHKPTLRDANKRVQALAEDQGLTPEQLADRLIPRFDLDEQGSMVLDYGPRRFDVTFDEQLRALVQDETGQFRKSLPKPGAGDDAVIAKRSEVRFKALNKGVKKTASVQRRRLEDAMVVGRRWTVDEFVQFFVGHPLVVHLVRRLVWGVFDLSATEPSGRLGTSFRVAEDRTWADMRDDEFEPPSGDGALIGLVHPVEFSESADVVDQWMDVFADYELTQPFEQLTRSVHSSDGLDPAAEAVDGYCEVDVAYQRILGLESRGWTKITISANTPGLHRELRDGDYRIDLNPGFRMGTPFVDQRLYPLRLGRPVIEVDPVSISELLRDLEWLVR